MIFSSLRTRTRRGAGLSGRLIIGVGLSCLLVAACPRSAIAEDTSKSDGTPDVRDTDDDAVNLAARTWRVQMMRAASPPTVDGVLDEEAWATAAVIDDIRQVEPNENAEPSQRTEVLLMFDDDALYVGVRCLDDPDLIIASTMQREGGLGADDRISFVIDSFFDRRNAVFFEINPLGARGDGLIEGRRFLKEWDGIWDGAARIDEAGWTAEIAIPFKTLSFNPNSTRWGFNFSRVIRRNNEILRWASPFQNRSVNNMSDAGMLTGLEGMKQGHGIDIVPYGVASWSHGVSSDGEDDYDLDAGMDVFWKITPSLTAAFTFNTDFAETEVDARRVNLTRFPLFFPEKRDFFLQDAGIFNFGGIRSNPLPFQSRRIGIGPDGEERDIFAGVKLTGRVNDLNIGLLNIQMKEDEELGNKNLSVARASYNVLEESTVGAIFTYGDPGSNDENMLAGFDFNYRNSSFNGDEVLEGNAWVQRTETEDLSGSEDAWGFKIRYPNDIVNWDAGYTRIGENFNAALGFVPRPGIHEYFFNYRYRIRPSTDLIRTLDLRLGTFIVTDLGGMTESQRFTFTLFDIRFESDDRLFGRIERDREVLVSPFEISSGVVIPMGDYRWDRFRIGGSTSSGRPLSVNGSVEWGSFYTGDRVDLSAGIQYRASQNLFLSAEISQNEIRLEEGEFTTQIGRARVNVYFTPDISWTNFVQYDNVSDTIGVNSRLRWITQPGNEVFIVVNQSFDVAGDRFATQFTELTTKVGLTFRF